MPFTPKSETMSPLMRRIRIVCSIKCRQMRIPSSGEEETIMILLAWDVHVEKKRFKSFHSDRRGMQKSASLLSSE